MKFKKIIATALAVVTCIMPSLGASAAELDEVSNNDIIEDVIDIGDGTEIVEFTDGDAELIFVPDGVSFDPADYGLSVLPMAATTKTVNWTVSKNSTSKGSTTFKVSAGKSMSFAISSSKTKSSKVGYYNTSTGSYKWIASGTGNYYTGFVYVKSGSLSMKFAIKNNSSASNTYTGSFSY